MARDTLHMELRWQVPPQPAGELPPGVAIRPLTTADQPALGRLIWRGFRGTVDDRYPTLADGEQEAADAFTGRWGPAIWAASLAAESERMLVSGAVVVRDKAHGYVPLLAFAVTHPDFRSRGIGRRLIEESVARLDSLGLKELHLAVTTGNPAATLYERLGFRVVLKDGG